MEIGSASAEKWWDMGRWVVHPKGANSMAASMLIFRSNLVGTGRAISILFGINGVRNQHKKIATYGSRNVN